VKLTSIKFLQAVRCGSVQIDKAEHGEACEHGVLIASDRGTVLVPWHQVRYADVIEEGKEVPAVTSILREVLGPSPLDRPLYLNPDASPPATIAKRRGRPPKVRPQEP
jgi:hypothetical protein